MKKRLIKLLESEGLARKTNLAISIAVPGIGIWFAQNALHEEPPRIACAVIWMTFSTLCVIAILGEKPRDTQSQASRTQKR
jgi:hypothetical protein